MALIGCSHWSYGGRAIGRWQCRRLGGLAMDVVSAVLAVILVAAYLSAISRWGADTRPRVGDERLRPRRSHSWW